MKECPVCGTTMTRTGVFNYGAEEHYECPECRHQETVQVPAADAMRAAAERNETRPLL